MTTIRVKSGHSEIAYSCEADVMTMKEIKQLAVLAVYMETKRTKKK